MEEPWSKLAATHITAHAIPGPGGLIVPPRPAPRTSGPAPPGQLPAQPSSRFGLRSRRRGPGGGAWRRGEAQHRDLLTQRAAGGREWDLWACPLPLGRVPETRARAETADPLAAQVSGSGRPAERTCGPGPGWGRRRGCGQGLGLRAGTGRSSVGAASLEVSRWDQSAGACDTGRRGDGVKTCGSPFPTPHLGARGLPLRGSGLPLAPAVGATDAVSVTGRPAFPVTVDGWGGSL